MRLAVPLIILAADVALALYALQPAPPPASVRSHRLGEGHLVVFRSLEAEPASVVAELDAGALPVATLELDLADGAVAPLGERIFKFSPRGVTEIVARRARESAPATLAEDRFREDARFETLLDAAGGERAILVAGRRGAALELARFDGVSFEAVAVAGDAPLAVDAVRVEGLGGERFAIAARSAAGLALGIVDGSGARWLPSIQFPEGSIAEIGLVPGAAGGAVACAALEQPNGGRALACVGFSRDGLAAGPYSVQGLRDGERLLALDDLDGGREPLALLTGESGARRASLQALQERFPAPHWYALWSAQRERFALPRGFHVVLLLAIGLLARARLARTPRSAAAREAGVVLLLAPLWRRLFALVVDLLLAGAATIALFAVALSGEEWALLLAGAEVNAVPPPALAAAWGSDLYLASQWVAMAYFAIAEGLTGRSPGKQMFGLRVVQLDGSPAGAGAAATRAVFLQLDLWLAGGLVGLASTAFTRRRQRVGDVFAASCVVLLKKAPPVPPAPPTALGAAPPAA